MRQASGAKSWWVCLIGALSFCLWGSNVLPIQHVEYKLLTNLAISQHRLPMLQKLASRQELSDTMESGKSVIPFSSLEIIAEDNHPQMSSNSELQSVRAKIRCPVHSSIKDVERSLVALTTPSLETEECHSFKKQLHQERWMLESCLHSMKRLALDLEHDRNALETERIAVQETGASKSGELTSPSPFRLTSFGTSVNDQPSPSMLMENLQHLAQARSENLESMLVMMERLKTKSRGFLSMTGSPLIEPVIRPLTRSRLIILFLLCALVWLLLMIWAHPSMSDDLLRQKQKRFKPKASRTKGLEPKSDRSVSDFNKTIQWLQREGIPYLGEIQLFAMEETKSGEESSMREASKVSAPFYPDPTQVGDVVFSTKNLLLLRNLGEGSLVLWIGLFVARFMFDPTWRELVVLAPLAAISRMITGIQ